MENNNSVCYIARINEIKEIPGAHNIEQTVIDGRNCVIEKGEFAEGDLVVVATTDAIIPQDLSDKLDIANYLRKGGRVRTLELRGVYSECLIIPIRILHGKTTMGDWDLKEGSDCMDFLQIFKYEPPVQASGRKIRYQSILSNLWRKIRCSIFTLNKYK
jgi:RNA ligase (TIGR02306 family)